MILGFGLAKNETGALTLVTCSLRGVGLKELSVTCFNIMRSLIFFSAYRRPCSNFRNIAPILSRVLGQSLRCGHSNASPHIGNTV